jgi:Cof subfamily protein (haloacid dehalogenase superfamily)
MPIQLIAVDLDETLLLSNKEPCSAGSAALREAIAKGIHVVIATSRRLASVREISEKTGITNQVVICADGALIMSHTFGEIWRLLSIPQAIASKIALEADRNSWEMTLVIGDRTYYRQREGQVLGHLKHDLYVADSSMEMLEAGEPIRMLVNDAEAINGLMAFLEAEKLSSKVNIQPYYGAGKQIRSLGIFPHGSNKGIALRYVCERLNIPLENTMAIGDGSNDIPMFQVAGTRVVMGNAHEDIKEYADFVCPTNDENGVAEALRHYS